MLMADSERGGLGLRTAPLGKSQATIYFLRKSGTNPLEKQFVLDGGPYGPL